MGTKADHRRVIASVIAALREPSPDTASLADTLALLLTHMHNHVPDDRARTTSVSITRDVARRIRALHRADPKLPQHEIARLVGTNQGRVNEVLRGVRT